jgi:hypothetical protein
MTGTLPSETHHASAESTKDRTVLRRASNYGDHSQASDLGTSSSRRLLGRIKRCGRCVAHVEMASSLVQSRRLRLVRRDDTSIGLVLNLEDGASIRMPKKSGVMAISSLHHNNHFHNYKSNRSIHYALHSRHHHGIGRGLQCPWHGCRSAERRSGSTSRETL